MNNQIGPSLVIVAYKPKPGKNEALKEIVMKHVWDNQDDEVWDDVKTL